LILRRLTQEDAPEIFYFRSDPVILQYLGREPARDIEEVKPFIDLINTNIDTNESILWGIALKESPGKLIGTICFWQLQKENYRSEIGYLLDPLHWKKGIMKEAINTVLEYGFSVMGLHSVEARLTALNTASAAVLEATGFVREGYFKEDFFYNGKFEDTAVYSKLHP
jgi:ribosomal-protein-alanine N-acetyltransferase